MTRMQLLRHMLQVMLQFAIAIETIAESDADKSRARLLQQRLDDWLGAIIPPET